MEKVYILTGHTSAHGKYSTIIGAFKTLKKAKNYDIKVSPRIWRVVSYMGGIGKSFWISSDWDHSLYDNHIIEEVEIKG